jgi:hypothetical protein
MSVAEDNGKELSLTFSKTSALDEMIELCMLTGMSAVGVAGTSGSGNDANGFSASKLVILRPAKSNDCSAYGAGLV